MFTDWRPKVLVAHTTLPSASLNCLSEKCELIFAKSNNRAEIIEKVRGVDGILWASVQKLNAEILNAAGPQLKSISIKSAGYDFVDVGEVRRRKIPIGYTPSLSASAVAEHAIGLALSAGRRYHDGRLCIEQGRWYDEPQTFLGMELRNSIIGIVGYGQIGRAIAEKLQSFKPQQIIYSGRSEKEETKEFSAKYVAFDDLLRNSDFIFISCALTPQTRKLFNAEAFEKMKKKSVLVNVARGDVVDQDALYDALKSFSIFSAGIDVTSPEPLPSNHPLMTLNNCGKSYGKDTNVNEMILVFFLDSYHTSHWHFHIQDGS